MNQEEIKSLIPGDKIYLNNPQEYLEIEFVVVDINKEDYVHAHLMIKNVGMKNINFHSMGKDNRIFLCSHCNAMIWNKI